MYRWKPPRTRVASLRRAFAKESFSTCSCITSSLLAQRALASPDRISEEKQHGIPPLLCVCIMRIFGERALHILPGDKGRGRSHCNADDCIVLGYLSSALKSAFRCLPREMEFSC